MSNLNLPWYSLRPCPPYPVAASLGEEAKPHLLPLHRVIRSSLILLFSRLNIPSSLSCSSLLPPAPALSSYPAVQEAYPSASVGMAPTIPAGTEPVWTVTGSQNWQWSRAVCSKGPQGPQRFDHCGVVWCPSTLSYGNLLLCMTQPSFQQGSGSRSRSWCSFSAPTPLPASSSPRCTLRHRLVPRELGKRCCKL